MVVAGWIPLIVGWSHLPDPAATHWGVNGLPDGRLPLWGVVLLPVFMAAVGLLTSSLFRVEGRPSAEAVAMVGLMGGLGLLLMISLVYLNWDAPTWQEAAAFTWPHLVVTILGAAAGGVLGYMVGRNWYPPPDIEARSEAPAVDVADGESVSWLGACRVTWPLLILGGVGVAFYFTPGWMRWIALLFVVLALLFSRVYVSVGNDGMVVRLGGVVVAKRIHVTDVIEARSIDLEPAAWGGWGWRIRPGRSAIILRRGDAIEVTVGEGRRFAVTVDDAATGAALLNGLAVRRAREG
jgi:hypothetical protein